MTDPDMPTQEQIRENRLTSAQQKAYLCACGITDEHIRA